MPRYIHGVSKSRIPKPSKDKSKEEHGDVYVVCTYTFPYLTPGDSVLFKCQCGGEMSLMHPVEIEGWGCKCGIYFDINGDKIVGRLPLNKITQAVEAGGVDFV